MYKLKEQQRLQQRAAFMEAQRRQAELNALIGQAGAGARSSSSSVKRAALPNPGYCCSASHRSVQCCCPGGAPACGFLT